MTTTQEHLDGVRSTDPIEHSITVRQVQMLAGRPFRASCPCGWASEIVGCRPDAVAAGERHLVQAAVSAHGGDVSNSEAMSAALEALQEQMRQAAYDEGYRDGQSAALQALTSR